MSNEFIELSEKIESTKKELISKESKHKYTCSKLDEEKEDKSLELKSIENLRHKSSKLANLVLSFFRARLTVSMYSFCNILFYTF